uniref:Superoxide dismutase copper chaperone n=1 Tax=Araucaria cunninghamii TaxID=56994 RepID=A0A0D6R2I3_ARACU
MALLKVLGLAIPAAAVAVASSNSSSQNSSQRCRLGWNTTKNFIKPHFLGSCGLVQTAFCVTPVTQRAQATHLQTSMETPQSNKDILPDLMTEYMVDMKCEGCVSSVRDKLEKLDGVKKVDVDLHNQVVRILGSSSLKSMTTALEETGRNARLIGQGLPDDFLVSAAVAEFKGPQIIGVVRFAQVNMELSRVEANFSGLSPGIHGWTINEYGDLTKGAASTGKIYNPSSVGNSEEPLGDLGTLLVGDSGEANFVGVKHMLKVVDLIGRALVLYEGEDKSKTGIAAAVIARSAGVGENYKKICACDGTVIWEATNSDYVKV